MLVSGDDRDCDRSVVSEGEKVGEPGDAEDVLVGVSEEE